MYCLPPALPTNKTDQSKNQMMAFSSLRFSEIYPSFLKWGIPRNYYSYLGKDYFDKGEEARVTLILDHL